MNNKNEIIQNIKTHCDLSCKYLIELHLQDENLSHEAIKIIKESFEYLKLNLEYELNSTL